MTETSPTPMAPAEPEKLTNDEGMSFDEICQHVAHRHKRNVLKIAQSRGLVDVYTLMEHGLTAWEALTVLRFLQAAGYLTPVPAWRVALNDDDDGDSDDEFFLEVGRDGPEIKHGPRPTNEYDHNYGQDEQDDLDDGHHHDRPGRWSSSAYG